MAFVHWLLIVSAAAVAEALQQPTQLAARDQLAVKDSSDETFRAVSSKMDELHEGLAEARADNLKVINLAKMDFSTKLSGLLKRNRDAASRNAVVAKEVQVLRKSNLDLRQSATDLMEQCHNVTSKLEEMQSNVSMAQEFIARAVAKTNVSLHDQPLQILLELDEKESIAAKKLNHDQRLIDLDELGSKHVSMIQLGVVGAKPSTQDILTQIFSSYSSLSDQQNASLAVLRDNFDKNAEKVEQQYNRLQEELVELNNTREAEQELNVKLQGAVDHLKITRNHLLQEMGAMMKFSSRLGRLPIDGAHTPPPMSLSDGEEQREQLAETPVSATNATWFAPAELLKWMQTR